MKSRSITELPHPYIFRYIRTVEQTIEKKCFFFPKNRGRHSSAFVMILSGSTTYNFGSYEFTVNPGDVMFLSKGSIYSMDVKDTYSFMFAEFDFCDEDTNFLSEVFRVQNRNSAEALFRNLLSKHSVKRPYYQEECCSLLYSIYAFLLKCHYSSYIPQKKRTQLENAVQFIAANYTKSGLTVSEVSLVAGMSEPHFRRLFKDIYSVPPLKYLNTLRIDRAKELLCYSNLSITEISYKTGFSGIYYFCRVFNQNTGCTPGEYRSLYGESEPG